MKEEIEKVGYQSLYPLMQHYSSQLFNGRVSIITICVILWAYILGVAKDATDSVITIGWLTATNKMLVAFVSALLIPMFASIENAYFKRFLDVIKVGRLYEDKYDFSSYFTNYSIVAMHPFFLFYCVNSLSFSLLFIFNLWKLNNWLLSIILSICIIIPFVHLIKVYKTFQIWAGELERLESSKETEL